MTYWQTFKDGQILYIIESLKALGYLNKKLSNDCILEQLRAIEVE